MSGSFATAATAATASVGAGSAAEASSVAHSDSPFYQSIIACLRTLANDASLTVAVGDAEGAQQCDLNLPLIEDKSNESLVALIRGLSDSYALMRLYHDAELHEHIAPADPISDRLFTLLERERFESVGSRRFGGVANNLNRMWALGHGEAAIARFGGAEQLEFALTCLLREQLNPYRLPDHINKHLAQIRKPIDDLVGKQLCKLATLVADQQEYGQCALDIVDLLGFDVQPRQAQATDNSTVFEECEAERDDDDPNATQEALEGLANVDNAPARSSGDEATSDDATVVVRNSNVEHVSEVDDPDINAIAQSDIKQRDFSANKSPYGYSVFSMAGDDTCSAAQLTSSTELKELRKELDHHSERYVPMIRQLAWRLQQSLLTKQYALWMHDLDEGELDPQRLSRLITAPAAAQSYRAQAEAWCRDTTVTLLIDNSRSMYGRPITTAAVCADLVSRILERCGVSSEVLGFTTASMYGGELADQWRALGSPENVGRLNGIRHIVYKSAETNWRLARENFGLMMDKNVLKQNIDGEALLWAQRRLLRRAEQRKILMVISDGRPSDSSTLKANQKNILIEHLKRVVSRIEKHTSIELIAIGIEHDVSAFYRNAFTVYELDQLGPLLLTELTRLLKR